MIEIRERDVFAVITEFLADNPTDEELLAYKLPEDLQQRLHYLLDLNGEGELNCDELHELDKYIRADDMVSLMKTKTKLRINELAAIPR